MSVRGVRLSSSAVSAPLLTEALPGFRAWHVDREGRLLPAAASGAWEPGVNVARCGHGRGHAVPGGDCSCGLYAFHHLHRQLAPEPVVGGIAAWGDMEVHRDGFRAGRARVLALAGDGPGTGRERPRLERAADRYGVPLVPRAALAPVVAERTGLLPASVLAIAPAEHDAWLARRRGYDAERQLWAEPGGGAVTVGVSQALRAWLVGTVGVQERSGTVRLHGLGAAVELATGVRGPVIAVNPRLEPAGGSVADPDGAGWVVRIAPTHWVEDCSRFDWGPAGRAGSLGRGRGAVATGFAHLLTDDPFDATVVRSWADVGRALRARTAGAQQAFADERALYDDVGIALGRAVTGAAAHIGRLDLTLALAVREPDAHLALDLRAGGVQLHCGGTGGARPDVTIELRGDDLRPLLAGELDLAQAAGAGRLRVRGPRSRALTALAVVVGRTRTTLREPAHA